GQSRVPGGDAWTCARGSGVCCQIDAASGGAGGNGSPGAAQRGTRRRNGVPSRGVAVSTTNSPTSVAPAGNGAGPSRRSTPGAPPWSVPYSAAIPGIPKKPGSTDTEPESSAGTGPAKTTQRAPVAVRSQR